MASITKRGNGWRVQIRHRGQDPIDGHFDTKHAAEAFARKHERAFDEGRGGIFRDMPIAKLAEYYEANARCRKKFLKSE